VMLALIGFQMGDVIMSFMSLLGHWKSSWIKKFIECHQVFWKLLSSIVYLISYTLNVLVLSIGYQVWKQILYPFYLTNLMFWIKLLNFKLGCNLFSFFGVLKPIVLMVETTSDIKDDNSWRLEKFVEHGVMINGGRLDNGIKSTQRRQVKETTQV
jgi:uncharacterized membrane protein